MAVDFSFLDDLFTDEDTTDYSYLLMTIQILHQILVDLLG